MSCTYPHTHTHVHDNVRLQAQRRHTRVEMMFGTLPSIFGFFGTALAAQSLLSPQFFNATLSHGVDVSIWGVAAPNTDVHVTVGGGAAVTAKVFD